MDDVFFFLFIAFFSCLADRNGKGSCGASDLGCGRADFVPLMPCELLIFFLSTTVETLLTRRMQRS